MQDGRREIRVLDSDYSEEECIKTLIAGAIATLCTSAFAAVSADEASTTPFPSSAGRLRSRPGFRFIACHPARSCRPRSKGTPAVSYALAVITLSHVRRHEIERELRRLERMMETGAL